MAAKELAAPLLQGTVSLNVSPQRFLSDSHYRSALRNFHKYDAGLWASTIRLQVNPFMLFPFTALVGFCLLLTAFQKFVAPPDMQYVFNLAPMVHTVLGAALSFVIVFRTNTAYVRP